ncbi:RNA polymerase sigma-70 factor, ECF subfamily [Chitinophaga ginsengisegetis]|uniref:RNA polymerase sigma-70 factor, ECF subfamily n=1 Tax=Chitinophaga ginsengisegetis TaxID=393003 RepID=A0A1T5N649_9BACT|nr:RNA polymerase sigma-70 factor [Chitinophaga ginsengisegetis]MDR6568689.1 RNA polymerase sigma-70 factor (ECF subfamily) [Chitinophaga ginsengisegetis]MDR6648080.1 RNA polymerase sigma-70 factor (ECF subfamily) [Chitinophaga ginsengisegetis]MDR6654770.1 RNA polymerase sigma-70 factor (ECF subfamily) [Chitinophaga ginsengisegetis]SKC95961.1 RNA polymerase sigma-70 factor, ECF subfamily [Chitinophaga ginsengisegetis]
MELIKSFERSQPYGEAELLQRLAVADEAAFSVVFREYYAVLCAFAQKIIREAADPEDLVNEVFLKLWNRRQVFEDIRHLKDFLYKSTRNACFDTIKGSIHSKERQAVFLGTQAEWETAADLEMIRLEVFNELHHEINQLPEQCGKIIRMGYIDGLKNDEIARELGLSVQTVKNQKSRGVMLLKRRLPPEVFVLLLLISAHS